MPERVFYFSDHTRFAQAPAVPPSQFAGEVTLAAIAFEDDEFNLPRLALEANQTSYVHCDHEHIMLAALPI